jgi:3',5'-cyclic AMP phosphodiesterase CpdA
VLGAPDPARSYSFVLIGDHQLKDPSTQFGGADLNNGSYPRLGENDAESMFIQQISEISYLDPDFILHVGDLVFGVDFREEYLSTLRLWWSRQLATYLVPGNHDGLALYELALKEGWWVDALKSIRCAKPLMQGEVTAVKVFELLICVLGDLKKILFQDLAQDGLDYWRRLLGPTDYSFDLGRIHFVGINSFSGTPERRHAFVLGLGFIGIEFDAATVDNYGGTLTLEQLAWLEQDLAAATRKQQTIVLFLHHDPRGNAEQAWGRRYHENQPFPTEPLGLRKFQEWNLEGEWDSDPKDRRKTESQTENSAVALLRLIAKHAHYVLNGHLHEDRDELIKAGSEIVNGSGIRTSHDIQFVRVTTASSTPKAESCRA